MRPVELAREAFAAAGLKPDDHVVRGSTDGSRLHLTDEVERQDTCINIYRRSLLYLVSNAFEHSRDTSILGMESFFAKRPSLTRHRPRRASV